MLTGICTQRGIVFKTDELIKFIKASGLRDFKARLTLSKTQRMGNRYTHREETLYREIINDSENLFIISRFSLDVARVVFKKHNPSKKWKLINKLPDGEDIPVERLLPGPTLDPNQQIISDYLDKTVYTESRIKTTRSSAVLVMGTGLGKTYLGVSKIKDFAKKTLIIVPSKVVMGEWQEALNRCYPHLIVGNYLKKTDGDVVLMVINTACSDTITLKEQTTGPGKKRSVVRKIPYFDYFKRFGFVIYDEIHNYTSNSRQKALWHTSMTYSLGLTATPDEDSWGMDIIFQKHVGPLINAPDIPNFNPEQVKWVGSYHTINYEGPEEYTKILVNPGTGYVSHSDMVYQFASDPYRTIIILEHLKKMYDNNRNVFIFFKVRSIADVLQDLIMKYVVPSGSSKTLSKFSTILMGGASDEDRDTAYNKSSFVLTTYGYGWQGVSIPKMDTLLFYTPRVAKMKQIIGRILRKSGDTTKKREIWDIVDVKTKLGKNEYSQRKNKIAKVVDFPKETPISSSKQTALDLDWVTPEVLAYVIKAVSKIVPETKDPDEIEEIIDELDDF